jgi:hypothetical protein
MIDHLSKETDHGTRIICAQLYKGGLSEASLILNKLRKTPFKGRSPEIGVEIDTITKQAERAYDYHLNYAIIIAGGAALSLISYAFNSIISAIILAVTVALMLWKSRYMDREIAINNFSKKEYNPNYGLERSNIAHQTNSDDSQNVIIFGSYFPFVGAGNRIKNWNLVIDTSKPSKSNDCDPGDISIDELYKIVDKELEIKNLENITEEFLLFADGTEIDSTFLKPYSVDEEPIYHLDKKIVFDEGHKSLYDEYRTYYSIKYFDKSRSTLLSAFLRFFKFGSELFVECSFYLLPPIDENRFNIDRIPIYDEKFKLKAATTTAIISIIVLAVGMMPIVSIIPLILVLIAAVSPLARLLLYKYNSNIINKDLKERIKKGEPHNYGNIKTFRESVSSNSYKNFFSAQDVASIQNSIEHSIINAMAKILDSKGIDSSLITGDLLSFVNKGIMMYGGKLEAEQVNIGSSIKTIQHIQNSIENIKDTLKV